jgi:protein SCO1/2
MTRNHHLDRRRFLGGSLGIGAAAALGGTGLLSACSLDRASSPGSTDPTASFGGTLVDPPFTKPDVTLTDLDGNPFPFIEKTEGQLTVLFFGYTNCPDVCPVFLQTMARAREAIATGPGSRPQVLFVGVDIARDTPEQMRTYLSRIDSTFIGLTGTEEEIGATISHLKMAPVTLEEPGPDGSYSVGHPATATVFTRDDVAHRIYPTGVDEEAGTRMAVWVRDLPRLDQGIWQ